MGTLRRVGIIGAGMSGLMAAVHLARQGHDVYLFDRAKYPGGTAGYYVRKGVQYPTGATITFGMERGGPLRHLLESVDVPFRTTFTHHSMDVVLSDRVVHIYSDREAWFGELPRAFPERSEAVVHFWRHVERTANTVYLRPIGPRTSLPGWLLAGDSVFPGPGTLSSAMSGFFAARCVDGRVMRRLKG